MGSDSSDAADLRPDRSVPWVQVCSCCATRRPSSPCRWRASQPRTIFQRLLASFPELLAGDQIDTESPRRFVLVAREQGIAAEEGGGDRWSLDHLFLDQDGIPTLVEVKRGTDTRIRREVVGQMLDYAANAILHWPLATLRARFSAQCQDDERDPDEVIAGLIGPNADREDFWAGVGANLQAGRIRLLFVADRIPPELRRVVEFLNRQMQPAEVLAVELR